MRFNLLIFVFVIALATIALIDMDSTLKTSLVVAVILSFLAVLVVGVSVIRTNLFIKSVCFLNSYDRHIAITFDDGPNPRYTPIVLDVLASYNAKASFFCIGNKIKGNEALLKRIYNEGHSIGNHTFEHSSYFPLWGPVRMMQSVLKTDAEISRVVQTDVRMFRPPYGVVNNFVAAMVAKLGKTSIGWSIRTKDTCRTSKQVIEKVMRKIKPGSVILLHDSHESIVEELTQILEYCKEKQLKPIALNI